MLVCLYALRGFTRPSYISWGGEGWEGAVRRSLHGRGVLVEGGGGGARSVGGEREEGGGGPLEGGGEGRGEGWGCREGERTPPPYHLPFSL